MKNKRKGKVLNKIKDSFKTVGEIKERKRLETNNPQVAKVKPKTNIEIKR